MKGQFKYILKIGGDYYGGIYWGEVELVGMNRAEKFDSEEDILKELNKYEFIIEELEGCVMVVQRVLII